VRREKIRGSKDTPSFQASGVENFTRTSSQASGVENFYEDFKFKTYRGHYLCERVYRDKLSAPSSRRRSQAASLGSVLRRRSVAHLCTGWELPSKAVVACPGDGTLARAPVLARSTSGVTSTPSAAVVVVAIVDAVVAICSSSRIAQAIPIRDKTDKIK